MWPGQLGLRGEGRRFSTLKAMAQDANPRESFPSLQPSTIRSPEALGGWRHLHVFIPHIHCVPTMCKPCFGYQGYAGDTKRTRPCGADIVEGRETRNTQKRELMSKLSAIKKTTNRAFGMWGAGLVISGTVGYSSFQSTKAKCPPETPTSDSSDTLLRDLGSVGEG